MNKLQKLEIKRDSVRRKLTDSLSIQQLKLFHKFTILNIDIWIEKLQ